jgi:hypothetical protein
MTAAAHFMVDRYVGFDVPLEIRRLLAVALRLLADDLEEARRVFERREAAGSVARPTRRRRAPRCRNRADGAHQPADRERPEPRTTTRRIGLSIDDLERLTTLGDLLSMWSCAARRSRRPGRGHEHRARRTGGERRGVGGGARRGGALRRPAGR